ncbi:MAG TPA: ABC-three component system middle component 1 [Bacilli bacterium]|nr:ABC-three component system middle component 1 [Bacilli bacterium]
MMEQLHNLFTTRTHLTKMEPAPTRDDLIEAVYASPQHLYTLVHCASEQELQTRWENVAEHVAVTIQSRLTGALSDLRWDIYLLYVVEEPQITAALQKQIENDRRFCRKLVLAGEDGPDFARLPLFFEVSEGQGGVMFAERDFLAEMKACLSAETAACLGDDFFTGRLRSADELVRHLTGGDEDAATGA